MEWVKAVQRLRARREAGVLVTVLSVRGHAPREAGAKMVVGASNVWGTVGGGNLEALGIERSRELITGGATAPEVLTAALSDKAPYQHGVQCCGGEVKLFLEPLPVVPSVAIFGVGHVGLELARILARHDLELHLVDSRADQLTAERLSVLDDAVAQVHVHNVPVLPELVVGELPPGTHAVIMTHDHAEDAALCDAAIRNDQLATIGLIGSSAKWTRFQRKLAEDGNSPEAIARITTPIGIPSITGKQPAVIAVSVAAWLLERFTTQTTEAPRASDRSAGAPRASDQTTEAQSASDQTAGASAAAETAARLPVPARSAERRPASAQRKAQA